MARKPVTDVSAWPALTLEGNLIAPAMVASIDRRQAAEQTEENYRIRKGLTIQEEISTAFRVGQSHFDAFAKLENPSVEATRRFVRAFLAETFGFDDLVPSEGVVSFLAGGRVPVVVVPPSDEKLDRRSPTLSADRSRSPAFALQDYLNDHDDALWGLATNGVVLRLMRDNASLTRPAYIEADLVQIFTNEDAASFAVLWSLIHRTRFGVANTPATDCPLEHWRESGSREGEAVRDRLAAQVEASLRVLGSGFLETNPDLASRLRSGELNLTEWFNELLRLVYRLIFLMVAEDRNLLHPESAKPDVRKLYAEGYSLAALRMQCARATTWDKHHDRYEGIKIVFSALAHGQQALGLPALGGLFSADKLPHLETARLRNRAFMEALYRLSWFSDKAGMVPVNWRAMETEELGSVYESLLELQPQLGEDGRTLAFASDAAEQKGNQRKTTGSYYTPDSLVQALLDTALDPVLDKAEAEAEDAEQALLKLSVIDPACGSGHFLLAAARRIATRLARIRAEGTPSLADFRHALRDVARSCLHGVDRNPMAVELTKVALWIETVDPGLPLGFFDAQIRCGDALLGVFDLKVLEDGIPDPAYKPLTGDDKDVAKYYRDKNRREEKERSKVESGFGFNRQRDFMRDFAELRAMPEDTVEQVEAKARRLKNLTSEGAGAWTLARACDLYVSAFLLPKPKCGEYAGPDGLPRRGAETVPTSGTLWEYLRGVEPFAPLFAGATAGAGHARAFHWPLEFPNIMQSGGFDVVLGNPPWERIKLQEQEFFAARSPEIANAPNKAARERLIKALEASPAGTSGRTLFDAFVRARRDAEAVSEFVRTPDEDSGRFPLTGRGDVNTYALFAELFSRLVGTNGRAGVIVPTGVATDDSLKEFFQSLVARTTLSSLLSFSEIRRWFKGTDDRKSFCLLTLATNCNQMEFMFGIDQIGELTDPRRRFVLTPEEIEAINPNTRTAPVFRSRWDADLTAKIYSNVPVLIDESKEPNDNAWNVSFMAMFHMSNDSGLFRTAVDLASEGFVRHGNRWLDERASLECDAAESDDRTLSENERGALNCYVPLYEAKMFHQFEHRFGTAEGMQERPTNSPWPRTSHAQLASADYEPDPWYWVEKSLVDTKLASANFRGKWHLDWRRGARNGDERTIIVSVLNASCGVGDNAFTIIANDLQLPMHALLCNLNSLVLDFAARQKISGSNISYYLIKQLPILPPAYYTPKLLAFIVPKVLELTYTSHSLTPFARDLGHDGSPFAWDEARRAHLRAELDAFYARAYRLTRDELRYILDPADVKGADYPSETFRVLKEKEVRQHGEYRTQRLVLAAWDRMEADGIFGALGLGVDVTAPVTPSIRIQPPPLDQVPDGAWIRANSSPQHDPGAALAAILKSLDGPTPIRAVSFAAVMMLEPHLLTPLLPANDAAEWRRLVGQEAEPRTGNVVGFAARTSPGWGTAVTNHRGNGRLIEDLAADTWARGTGLEAFETSGWPDGRAAFVLDALRNLDIDTTASEMPDEVRDWIVNAATG